MNSRLFWLGVVAAAWTLAGCGKAPKADAITAGGKAAPAPVTVTKVLRRDLPLEIAAIGNVRPLKTVEIRAQVGGVLQAVHFKEGDWVAQGQLLMSIDPAPFQAALRQAEANLERAKVEARNAESQMSRYTELKEKGAASKEQYDQIQSAAQASTAQIRAGEAAVETARLQLGYAEIRAPFDGRVGSLLLDEGNLVKANSDNPLVVINQTKPILVDFAVPERHLADIRSYHEKSPLEVIIRAPQSTKELGRGKLVFIDNKVNGETGTVALRARIENKEEALWPGQFVQVALLLTEEKGVLVVDQAAIQTGQQGKYAFAIRPDGTAEVRAVDVARTAEGLAVIAKGLSEGETVVLNGHLRVVPGGKVEVKP